MKINAAVLRGPTSYSIEELKLEPPKQGEVLVRYIYTGYCHSDLTSVRGGYGMILPRIGGHECSGIVEELGPGCTKLKKGDHVVATFVVPCGECIFCRTGNSVVCTGSFQNFVQGLMLDGTSRIKDKKGEMVRHGGFVSGFSDYSVMPEAALIPIPKDFPLDWACLMGCCIPTGWGAVFNAAKVKPHQSVAIYGAGGVGCNTIRAAKLAFADPVIVVDLEPDKEELAREFGATHFICNSKEDPVPKIMELTGGAGVDVAFEVIGDPGAIVQAYWSLAVAGVLIQTGVCRADQQTSLPLIWMPFKKRSIVGHLYGNINTHVDIPNYVDMASKNDMKLDKLITGKFKLKDINDVADKLEKRQIKGRWILAWD